MTRTTTVRSLMALLTALLVLTACSGADETTAGADGAADDAPDDTAPAEEPAAEDGGSIDPALFDPATCDVLDGQTIDGVGTLSLLSTSQNDDLHVLCFYENGPDGEGTQTTITLNGDASTADRTLLANFEGEGVEPVDGWGAAAILQDGQGLRAYFDGGLLVNVAVRTTETGEDGLLQTDLDRTMLVAEALRPTIDEHVD